MMQMGHNTNAHANAHVKMTINGNQPLQIAKNEHNASNTQHAPHEHGIAEVELGKT